MHLKFVFIALLTITSLPFRHCEENLYNVLGVRKTATQQEIKRAYKKLAKEWHPDKTNDPEATDKFTKIAEAYETLGDPQKRHEYDNFGYTSATGRQPQRQQHGFDPFDSFFNGPGGFNFNFNFGGGSGGGESIIDKHLITIRQYETTILPNSYHKPCVIYAFTDFCFNCMRIEATVEKFLQELQSVGLCGATFHAGRSGTLASELRITQVPSIVGVINDRISFFRGGVSIQTLREFVRNLFPTNLVTQITNTNVHEFLDGWPMDNKVRAIYFGARDDKMSVPFLAAAFSYKDNVAFGFVHTKWQNVGGVLSKYNINKHRETLLMFNEETTMPVATISMQQLSRASLDEVIEGNKYLQLPRLSSQKFFEELCPQEVKVKNRKLCVVLITKKGYEHDSHRDTFRKFTQRSRLADNMRVQFAYVYEDTQQDFVKALSKGKQLQTDTKKLKVAIIWRVEKYEMKYEWLETGWELEKEKLCTSTLEDRLNMLLTTDTVMPYKVTPPLLYNEHGLGLLTRIGYKLLHWGERIWRYTNVFDSTTLVTMVLSLIFVAGMGYFVHKLASLEEIQVQSSMPPKTKPRPSSRTFDAKNLNLYELDYRTYPELVSEADTGLTITILVDKEAKDRLVKRFATIVHPYSRYSALTFAFLQLEYNIEWYRSLLQQSVDDIDLKNINIKNCIGTVLAINGYRKYYYIYSARRARQFIRRRNNVSEALGLDDLDEVSDNEDDIHNYFFLDEVLDGLALWMDKIFDGTIKKIRINEWPKMKD